MPTLTSWNDGTSKRAIEEFVNQVTTPGSPAFVEPAARVAVFDNDGTLWCEKPMPIDVSGAEKSLALAKANGWTVVSMKNEWRDVFH